ncbi:MAG: DUF2958 domain-containing protein [Bacteroidetes bacterium]|nr:DUF2958 domain-containing protein [Bacteroidota bacterium]
MLIIDKETREKLLENGKPENRDQDHPPVVQISILSTDCVWLLSDLDPDAENIAFGLCDLGMGFPELGYVDLNEIAELSMSASVMPIIFVNKINATHQLTTYYRASLIDNKITTDEKLLIQASQTKTQ